MATTNSPKEEIKNSLKQDAFPITSHKDLLSSFICGPDEPICIIGDLEITPEGVSTKIMNEQFPFEDAEKFTEYLAEIYGIMD